jgi:hypothetical protein
MSAGHTHIAVILDRTGSMEVIRDDTIGGFNAFLEEQQAAPGAATLTLVQFDSQDPYEVIHHNVPIADVPRLTRETYVPRAMTPLLDALGRGILDLEHSLASMPEEQRPERVVMAVITDGQENASREFSKEQVTRLIQDKQALLGWQFVFLSADLQAIEDAIRSGVRQAQAMAFDHSGQGVQAAMRAFSTRLREFRGNQRQDVSFEQEDRDQQASEGARKQS